MAVRRIAQRPDLRAFVQDGFTRSEMVTGDAAHLSDFHLKVYAGLTHGVAEDKKGLSLLVLGAGGYVLPRHLQAAWPSSRVTVVEVDPGVTRTAVAAFGLDARTTIQTIHADPRSYVDRLRKERARRVKRLHATISSTKMLSLIVRRAGAVADEGIQ